MGSACLSTCGSLRGAPYRCHLGSWGTSMYVWAAHPCMCGGHIHACVGSTSMHVWGHIHVCALCQR